MNLITSLSTSTQATSETVRSVLHVRLFGTIAAWDMSGKSVLPRGRKTRALLALLALAAPAKVSRREITALLWSTRMPAQARGSLRQAVHELQDILGAVGGPRLYATREHLALEQDGLWVDLSSNVGPQPITAALVSAQFGLGTGASSEPSEHRKQSGAGPHVAFLSDLTGLDPAFDSWLREERAKRVSAPKLPNRPPPVARALRVGVLPPCLSDTGQLHPLSLGLAEEITSALACFRWIDCLGPARLMPHGVPPLPGCSTCDELALDFMLDGSIQATETEHGTTLRISIRLLDMRNAGTLIWSRRFERTARSLIEFQDEVAGQIAAQLDPELALREGARLTAHPSDGSSPYELLLRAIPAIYRLDPVGYPAAGDLLEQAITIAPDYAAAHAWYAYWHLLLIAQGWDTDHVRVMRRAAELADRAVMLDPLDARALTIAGHIRAFLYYRLDEATILHDRALALNPNLPLALVFSGLVLAYRGEHDAAIARILHCRVLAPLDPHAFMVDVALMLPYLLRGEYQQVVAISHRSSLLNPDFSFTYKILLSALGHLGRHAEAADVHNRLLRLEPDFTVRMAIARSPLRLPEDLARYADGLRKAGVLA